MYTAFKVHDQKPLKYIRRSPRNAPDLKMKAGLKSNTVLQYNTLFEFHTRYLVVWVPIARSKLYAFDDDGGKTYRGGKKQRGQQ